EANSLLHKRTELVQEYGRGELVTAQAQRTCAGIRARRTRYCTSATNLCRNTGEARTLLHKRTELVQEYRRSTNVTAQDTATCAGIRARRTRYCTSATNLCRNTGEAHSLLHKRNELVQEYGRGTHVTAQAYRTCAGIRARHTRYCTSATNLCSNAYKAHSLLY